MNDEEVKLNIIFIFNVTSEDPRPVAASRAWTPWNGLPVSVRTATIL